MEDIGKLSRRNEMYNRLPFFHLESSSHITVTFVGLIINDANLLLTLLYCVLLHFQNLLGAFLSRCFFWEVDKFDVDC